MKQIKIAQYSTTPHSEWNLNNLFQCLAINIMPYCICAANAYADLDFIMHDL